MERYRVIIAGGGAAGIFAAVACAEANPDCQVTVLERGKDLLSKVKISGGGRCNVTHACFEPNELVKNYPRGHLELRGPFHRWGPHETVDWFQQRGVNLKTEADGRMFPETDDAQTIIDCLLKAARAADVKIQTKCGLIAAQAKPNGAGFWLTLADTQTIECEKLLIASGSLRSSKSAAICRALGHTVEPLVPSLFTFHIQDPRIQNLAGISVANINVSIPDTRLSSRGPVLITHWGLSGPAILKLSAWGARDLHAMRYQFPIVVNWIPDMPGKSAHKTITEIKKRHPRRHVRSKTSLPIPHRLWERITRAANIDDETIWATLSKEHHQALAHQLNHSRFNVSRKSMNKEEFVTCGGVALKEVNFKTMESKIYPGLYFAGESLNIDGVTGGFNFQAAWTTGRLAGQAMGAG